MENNSNDQNENLLDNNEIEKIFVEGTMKKIPLLENETKRKNIFLIKIFDPKTCLYYNKLYKKVPNK
jgi:hypothetical protein